MHQWLKAGGPESHQALNRCLTALLKSWRINSRAVGTKVTRSQIDLTLRRDIIYTLPEVKLLEICLIQIFREMLGKLPAFGLTVTFNCCHYIFFLVYFFLFSVSGLLLKPSSHNFMWRSILKGKMINNKCYLFVCRLKKIITLLYGKFLSQHS